MDGKKLFNYASDFANELSELLNSTISDNVKFNVLVSDRDSVYIGPSQSNFGKSELIPITSSLGLGEQPFIWLKVGFEVTLDREEKYLRVINSTFALVTDKEKERPAIRIEYERERGSEPGVASDANHVRNAAHVQIHGISAELSYVQGANRDTKHALLQKYHFPVGGKEFRPTLEDFIEFLYREKIVKTLKPGWQLVIKANQQRWLELQVKSAVRSNPEAAVQQLIDLGYKVAG